MFGFWFEDKSTLVYAGQGGADLNPLQEPINPINPNKITIK
jgi:hypothetical protein